MKSPRAQCPHCGRLVRVVPSNGNYTPFFSTHVIGKSSHLATRGGLSPRAKCPGSLMATHLGW